MPQKIMDRVHLMMECDVSDTAALWDAAADRAARDFGMTPDDVTDTIGPREDPEIEACAYMLLDSLLRGSGAFEAFHITSPRLPAAPAPARVPPARSRSVQPATVVDMPQIRAA